MKPFSGRLSRYGSVLLFPLAMIIYDFSAYLTTDLIQPGVINIINELQAIRRQLVLPTGANYAGRIL